MYELYEEPPKMPLHLGSRASRVGDMAEALYWAIEESGLRLPSRREIAHHSRVSEATISRRMRDAGCGEDRLATLLVSARDRTHPQMAFGLDWSRWLPMSDLELRDVRAWIACLALATPVPDVGEAVRLTWEHERDAILYDLVRRSPRARSGDSW